MDACSKCEGKKLRPNKGRNSSSRKQLDLPKTQSDNQRLCGFIEAIFACRARKTITIWLQMACPPSQEEAKRHIFRRFFAHGLFRQYWQRLDNRHGFSRSFSAVVLKHSDWWRKSKRRTSASTDNFKLDAFHS
jgi:hypothetical protein